MNYFVVVYDRLSGESSVLRTFSAEERAQAMQNRFELEDEFKDRPNVEIVVLGADSQDSLMRTHSRYFKTAREMILEVNSHR